MKRVQAQTRVQLEQALKGLMDDTDYGPLNRIIGLLVRVGITQNEAAEAIQALVHTQVACTWCDLTRAGQPHDRAHQALHDRAEHDARVRVKFTLARARHAKRAALQALPGLLAAIRQLRLPKVPKRKLVRKTVRRVWSRSQKPAPTPGSAGVAATPEASTPVAAT